MSEAVSIGLEAVVIPFTLFVPLIKDVADVLIKVVDLYQTAQHNRKIADLLKERTKAANNVIVPLKEDKLNNPIHYANLQRLVIVLKKMEIFCGEITQYNKLKKFLEAKSIESKYKDLCEDYDSSVSALSLCISVSNLAIMTEFKNNSEKEFKILKEEIQEVLKFQSALSDSMTKSDEKLTNANEKLDKIVTQVGEMHDTMQKLQNEHEDKSFNQKKIDNIFNEVPLPFDDYNATGESRGESKKLRKYIHIKNLEEYAFKTVEEDQIDQVKNQVTILKKIQDCQNVIRFYGFTVNDEDEGNKKYYLVTEWADKGNLYEYIIKNKGSPIETDLKLRYAFDIAKGLNFLNALKIVHRDIRSENVIITDHDVAKITNFKLSRGTNEATGNLAVNKEILRHNSPEILKRGVSEKQESKKKKKYDTKCEVYSFGILLWEIAEFKIAYQDFEDFLELSIRVMDGYREPFSPDIDIPERYKQLVIKAVDQEPDDRPTFANMLTDLQDIFKKENPSRSNTAESCTSNTSNIPNTLDSNRPKPPPPVRKDSLLMFNLPTMTIDEAEEHHNKNTKDKSELYKCFDSYAMMDNPKGKYWKAYYISKNWSDLKTSKSEKDALATELFKEVADYGDEFPEAQLRYASMIMRRSGPTPEAIEYLLKAAKNDHPVAMFNVATYYFGKKNEELGRYYMIKSANRKYPDAIKYCTAKKIQYIIVKDDKDDKDEKKKQNN